MRRLPLAGARAAMVAGPALGAGYLGALSLVPRRRPTPAADSIRFLVVVPAHDEEDSIAATVADLSAVDYPAGAFRVVVVADNCSDATADKARAAGAEVLERVDPDRRGKGWALRYAFDRLLDADTDTETDAVVVVDADTVVSSNLLTVLAGHLKAGAAAVQADYRVREGQRSWRTDLVEIGFACSHRVRAGGRDRLGLSVGLKGNGMAIRRDVLEAHAFAAYSEVEDLEYGVQLALAGVRVVHAPEACVYGLMPATGASARSQRIRWERGRAELRRRYVRPLLRRALTGRDPVAADAAIDLLVPPMAQLGAATVGGLAIGLALDAHRGRRHPTTQVSVLAVAALLLHVARGWQVSGTGRRGLAALARTPVFLAWKASVRASTAWRRQPAWQRAERAISKDEER